MTRIRTLLALLTLVAAPAAFAQEGPKFGGCLKDGTTCFAPTVSLSPVAISLKDGAATVGVNLGLGYGVTFASNQWWKYGVSLNVALRDTTGGQKPLVSALGSFAEYVRLGFAYQIGGGSQPFKDGAMFLVGLGADFGAAR